MSELIRSNKRRSAAVVAGFVIVVVALAAAVGALVGNVVAFASGGLVVAGLITAVSFWKAERIALRVGRARPASPEDYPRLHNLIEGLCIAGGLPKPDVYVVDDPAPNAFAAGRNPSHASIAVTTGLLEQMNRVELEGVVAHELSHIRNYDIMVSTLAVTMVGAAGLTADMAIRAMWWNGGRVPRRGDRSDRNNPVGFVGLGLLVAAPLVAKLMQVSIVRERETLADVSACQLTRYPPGLISALEKLRADTTATHAASTATAHLWIGQPMSGVADDGRLRSIHRMYDTHPPLDERIALLREL